MQKAKRDALERVKDVEDLWRELKKEKQLWYKCFSENGKLKTENDELKNKIKELQAEVDKSQKH